MVKYILTFFLLSSAIVLKGQNNMFRGYLITLDGKHILGHIGSIDVIKKSSYLYFKNDFGTDYSIPPELIRGFALRKDSINILFESHSIKRNWVYLQIVYYSHQILVYQIPQNQRTWYYSDSNGNVRPSPIKSKALWVKIPGQKKIKVRRYRFKKRMRRYFRKTAPSIAKKIGKLGYQFKDIFDIVEEYDQFMDKNASKIRL